MTFTPFFATQFNIEPNQWSDQHGLHCKDPSLAQQQFKDECDINVLMARYLETGTIPQVEGKGLAYGDFTGIFDFQSAMNAVNAARDTFGQLPARIKNRFDNDPQKLLQFLDNPDNREEAEFLGLVNRKEPTDGPASNQAPQGHPQNPPRPSGTQGNPPAAAPIQGPGSETPSPN